MKKAHEKKNIPIEEDLKESIRKIQEGFIPGPLDKEKINEEQYRFIANSCSLLVELRDHYDSMLSKGIVSPESTLAAISNFEPVLPLYLEACRKRRLKVYEFILSDLMNKTAAVKQKINSVKR